MFLVERRVQTEHSTTPIRAIEGLLIPLVLEESDLDSFDDVGIGYLLLKIGRLVKIKMSLDASRFERNC
jgi:hypothetical protein